jgi:methionyl aminopeptidase
MSSSTEVSEKCASPGCNQLSPRLCCPKCIQLGLPATFFCSQECFKANYAAHNQIHKIAQLSVETVVSPHRKTPPNGIVCEPTESAAVRLSLPKWARSFEFTGTLRPTLISPMRTVPPSIKRPDYAVCATLHLSNLLVIGN